MLQLLVRFCALTVNLDGILGRVLFVRHKSRISLVSIVVQTALFVCNTNSLNGNGRCEIGVLLSDEVVAFVECVFDHATHARVLVDVTDLRSCLQACLFFNSFIRRLVLRCKLLCKLFSFFLDLSESRILFGNFALKFFIGRRVTTATTADCSSWTGSSYSTT